MEALMGIFARRREVVAAPLDKHAQAIEQAWRIHGALADWTGKVDAKASFALAGESAVIATIIALSDAGRRLSDLSGWVEHVLYWAGLALLVAAATVVISVVTPQLRADKTAAEWPENFIFFGHLRHWDSVQLASALENNDVLPVLSRQLVAMSAIAWKKHRRLQLSLSLSVLGTAFVGVAALLTGL